jgi:hypothetical protein
MITLLDAFFRNPTAAGAFFVLVAVVAVGMIRLTAAATRGAIAVEGIRIDWSDQAKKQVAEHVETRAKIETVRTEFSVKIDGLHSKVDGVRQQVESGTHTVVKSLGEDGEVTRTLISDRRLSEATDAMRETATIVAATSQVDPEEARPTRSRTGAGIRASQQ